MLPVPDDPSPDAVPALESVELLVLVRDSLLQRGRRGKDLEDRSGFIGIGDAPVGQRRRRELARPVGIEGRGAGHGQDLAGPGLHQDDGARGCGDFGDGALEFLFGNGLQVGIDRQLDVGPGPRFPHHPAVPLRSPAVGPDRAPSGFPAQGPVEGKLDAAQAVAIGSDKAQNMGPEFAAGIEAAELLDGPDGETGLHGARDLFRGGLALEPGKARGPPQPACDQLGGDFETRRETAGRGRNRGRGVVGWDRVHRVHRDGQRQRPSVSVVDSPPERRDREFVMVLAVGAPHHGFVVQELDLDQLAEDQGPPDTNQNHPHHHSPPQSRPASVFRRSRTAGRLRRLGRHGRGAFTPALRSWRGSPRRRLEQGGRQIGEQAVRRGLPAARARLPPPGAHRVSELPGSARGRAGPSRPSRMTRSPAGSSP